MVGRKNDGPGIVAPNVYQFVVNDSEGNLLRMKKYQGYVLLIVNVATWSTLAELNYQQLYELQKVYEDRKFKVLLFPSNQLGAQEPDDAHEVVEWARQKHWELEIFDKIDVNGPNSPLLWRYLKTCRGGMMGNRIQWNFTKFIVDRKGRPVERHGPAVCPSKLARSIENYLNEDVPSSPDPVKEVVDQMIKL